MDLGEEAEDEVPEAEIAVPRVEEGELVVRGEGHILDPCLMVR